MLMLLFRVLLKPDLKCCIAVFKKVSSCWSGDIQILVGKRACLMRV